MIVNPKIILVSGYARAGKDTFASNMIRPLGVAHRVSFAYELKEIANKTLWMLGLTHIDLHRDEDKVKYRDILIGIARTARAADPSIFARLACRRIDEVRSAGAHVIITDWRYSNEHEYLCEKYGHGNMVTVMVEREGGFPAHEEEERSIAGILNSININVRVVAKDGDISPLVYHAGHLASAINGGSFDLP